MGTTYNPWRESLENCIDGSNYLRASEYRSLINELGAWYEQEAQVRALLWDEHPECCGNAVIGAEYMGSVEMICCGNPEPSLLNDAQIVASLRSMFPAEPDKRPATAISQPEEHGQINGAKQ